MVPEQPRWGVAPGTPPVNLTPRVGGSQVSAERPAGQPGRRGPFVRRDPSGRLPGPERGHGFLREAYGHLLHLVGDLIVDL